MPKPTNNSLTYLTVNFGPDMRGQLAAVAAVQDRTLSSVIRVAVREYLDRNGPAPQGERAA